MSTIGILPAAGKGTRLSPFGYPKELLPIAYHRLNERGDIVPSLVIDHSINAMRIASVRQCFVVISSSKSEIARVLGSGEPAGPRLAYVIQPAAAGLADAVKQTYPFIAEHGFNACLALPDTQFEPVDAISRVSHELEATKADLVLGVFPVDNPHELGPVRIGSGGVVERVFDKPARTEHRNTWGIAAWSPAFFDLLMRETAGTAGEVVLGAVFDRACEAGLMVRAVSFASGIYRDLGTPGGLTQLIRDFPPKFIPTERVIP